MGGGVGGVGGVEHKQFYLPKGKERSRQTIDNYQSEKSIGVTNLETEF